MRCGYSGGHSSSDTVLIAVQRDSLVGVVRLCSEHQITVLRGMQVLPDFQQQGIGRALLEKCLSKVGDAVCYCIPWSHLEQFYSTGGFKRCEKNDVPEFLSERFSGYVAQGRDVILMRRDPLN
ncbi:MAG: GNAT family N-acetyltransferase [Woeseiaceae bacterium]|nr:GNAT family N-acetyltransferase [Woeseiaceae bacterium]